MKKVFVTSLVSVFAMAVVCASVADAGPLRDRIIAKRMEKAGGDDLGLGELDTTVSKETSKAKTVAYGADAKQVVDIYGQAATTKAPVIIMVHGGGWRHGSRQAEGVVDNKLKHYSSKGYVFVSIDYRLMPEADPMVQAQDVSKAIAYVQGHIAAYGGDPDNIVIMGHSAGGHLVALISADPSIAIAEGAKPWRGTVVLDAGALDTVASLSKKTHLPLYDKAFGADPAFWARVSPMARLKSGALPMMLVCSTERKDKPCDTAEAFALKAKTFGLSVPVSGQALNHAEVNKNLGLAGDYTSAVDAFIAAHLRP